MDSQAVQVCFFSVSFFWTTTCDCKVAEGKKSSKKNLNNIQEEVWVPEEQIEQQSSVQAESSPIDAHQYKQDLTAHHPTDCRVIDNVVEYDDGSLM